MQSSQLQRLGIDVRHPNAARDLSLRKPERHHGASVLLSKFCRHLNDRQAYSP